MEVHDLLREAKLCIINLQTRAYMYNTVLSFFFTHPEESFNLYNSNLNKIPAKERR